MLPILFVINQFILEAAWLVACHDHSVTGEVIIVNDEPLAGTRKASDRGRRARGEELVDRGCVPTANDVPANRPPQVQINVNVQVLRLECKSGWFEFFRREPRMHRLERDRFVEIAADARSSDVPALIEKVMSLLDVVPPHHIGSEANDTAAFGHRGPSAYAAVCDDDPSPDSRGTGAPALDIWV
jgi:hypothetical protein